MLLVSHHCGILGVLVTEFRRFCAYEVRVGDWASAKTFKRW